MKNLIIALIALTLLSGCGKNSFGKYFTIPEAGIQMPFAGPPVKVSDENQFVKSVNYEYAYQNPNDDSNYIYGVEVIDWKNDNKSNLKFLISQTADLAKSVMDMKGGTMLETRWSKLKGRDCIIQKSKIDIPEMNGEVIVTGLIFANKESIVRLHVSTPVAKADNKRIQDFFDEVEFD